MTNIQESYVEIDPLAETYETGVDFKTSRLSLTVEVRESDTIFVRVDEGNHALPLDIFDKRMHEIYPLRGLNAFVTQQIRFGLKNLRNSQNLPEKTPTPQAVSSINTAPQTSLNICCKILSSNANPVQKSFLYEAVNINNFIPNVLAIHPYNQDICNGYFAFVLSGHYQNKNAFYQLVVQLKLDLAGAGLLLRPHHLIHRMKGNNASNGNIQCIIYNENQNQEISFTGQSIHTHGAGAELVASPSNLPLSIPNDATYAILKTTIEPIGQLTKPMTTHHILLSALDYDFSEEMTPQSLIEYLSSLMQKEENAVPESLIHKFLVELENELSQLEGI